eukprot:GCRY01002198.1.p1 GENE.GCRY01002198.1~~GCRY01002198.1.p1  ORF type:complete len:194 (-),score=40.00 GCRY01002198.1:90-605(-)
MEETVEERKARLLALRAERDSSLAAKGTKRTHDEIETTNDIETEDPKPEPLLKFRNYQPKDSELKDLALEPSTGEDYEKVDAGELAKEHNEFFEAETNLVDLAPKRANWDLKRNVESRLKKLEKRTLRALSELASQNADEESDSSEDESESEDEDESESGSESRSEGGSDE